MDDTEKRQDEDLENKRQSLTMLIKRATEEQIDRAFLAILNKPAAPISPAPPPTPSRQRKAGSSQDKRDAPISTILHTLNRATPEQMVEWVQSQPNIPHPHEPAEALTWIVKTISRAGSKRVKRWPDGSYSLITKQPKLVA